MNMDGLQHIESLQTLSRLCNLINDSNYYSSNYRIAKYLLENLYNIQNTSIYDIAEAAYTSIGTKFGNIEFSTILEKTPVMSA